MSAAPLIKDALRFRVNFQSGPLAGQSFNYQQSKILIGRGADNDLVLTNDLKASRQHASIKWDGFELHIVNLSKKNFMVVNGTPVQSAKLDSGTVVLIGDSQFIVDFDQESKTQIRESAPPAPNLVAVPPDPNVVPVHMTANPILQQTHVNQLNTYNPGAVGGALSSQPHYTTNIPGAGQPPRRTKGSSRRRVPSSDGGRLRFYIIVVLIGVGFWWLMQPSNIKKKDLSFRSTEQIEQDIQASREEMKEFEARKEKLDSVQFKRAQENYIRGFRDYKQGNYSRARESFQVVLNLDPNNELAKRYYHLSKVKFDELVKFNMLQGNRYREKKNWRMCKSSYFAVMTMLNNGQDPIFKEAKQYYDQCSLAEEGRF